MDYAGLALAFLAGIACGAAIAWWWQRASAPAKPRTAKKRRAATRVSDDEIRRFQMASNAMAKLLDAERYDEAFNIARTWCNRAPQFVESWAKLNGGFDLKEVPPIEYAAQHMVALRDVSGLRRLRDVMMARDELKPWQNLLAEEIVAANELDRIFDVVERNPGIAQDTAVRRVDAGIRRAFKSLHDADLRHLIRRERNGSSYALYRN
jgi:hypothetical protein